MSEQISRRIAFDPALLARVEAFAALDRRTFSNYVAAVLERALDYWEAGKLAPPPDSIKVTLMQRTKE